MLPQNYREVIMRKLLPSGSPPVISVIIIIFIIPVSMKIRLQNCRCFINYRLIQYYETIFLCSEPLWNLSWLQGLGIRIFLPRLYCLRRILFRCSARTPKRSWSLPIFLARKKNQTFGYDTFLFSLFTPFFIRRMGIVNSTSRAADLVSHELTLIARSRAFL